MKSSLAYIDAATEGAVTTRSGKPSLSDADRKAARVQATKSVAGFDVFDEEAERKSLDAIIAKNREAVETFIAERKAIREKLAASGVTPLAVVPLASWKKLLRNAGLFMLAPDSAGRVHIATTAFDGLPAASAGRFTAGEDKAETLAKQNGSAWLKRCFPTQESKDGVGAVATLVLPVPPADVIDTLVKLSRAGVAMKTAAVAEAIAFKESIPQLRRLEMARREEEARRLEALRADPIVYTEHGGVAAVVAQFGDFPIEMEVVDAVVAADDFIPEKPKASHFVPYGLSPISSVDDAYLRALYAAQSQVPQGWQRTVFGSLIG